MVSLDEGDPTLGELTGAEGRELLKATGMELWGPKDGLTDL